MKELESKVSMVKYDSNTELYLYPSPTFMEGTVSIKGYSQEKRDPNHRYMALCVYQPNEAGGRGAGG